MNENPFNLGDKKERNDFLIALAVIAFFGLLFWWLFFNNKPIEISNVAKAEIPAVVVDADGDGIADEDDRCPLIAGVSANDGCPADSDGDGIYDNKDRCPNYAGTKENKGCPLDADGDGIHNGLDKCPDLAGVSENDGCPSDKDGDGVYDTEDRCPNRPGLAADGGSPKIQIDEAEQKILQTAIRDVKFKTGSAELVPSSRVVLDKIVALMEKYPAYKLSINGHTDSQGDSAKNMQLSRQRARAAKEYLVSKNIRGGRIIAKGFGSKVPVDSNETAEGRKNNRRIEFIPSY